ncbi:hypothetical protein SAMN05446927_5383 [Caballeronia arationis]|uniref:Uncharacterized protein n=1 Tax=Caballeronia arationis TaxID=1777142 RepID=A0A7Z7N4R2_9BURK|nr:hypothetical protein [Caballeronia arationis]SOE82075.1 hypothetical protein SAMN05446927_5383 [Caballeronia arationis]
MSLEFVLIIPARSRSADHDTAYPLQQVYRPRGAGLDKVRIPLAFEIRRAGVIDNGPKKPGPEAADLVTMGSHGTPPRYYKPRQTTSGTSQLPKRAIKSI